MKKVGLLVILLSVFLLSGCSLGKRVTKCSYSNNQSNSGYNIDSQYNIISKNNNVVSVETIETVTSENTTVLAYFEKTLKDKYEEYNKKYKGYTINVTNKDGKVVSKVTIDYSKMDVNKFIKDNPSMKLIVNKNNKITLDGIKKVYQSMGATCE